MERRKRRISYTAGTTASYTTYDRPGEKKRKKKRAARIRMALAGLALALLVAIAVFYLLAGTGRENVGRATRIAATLNQNVMPFGENILFYDGTSLHCVAATGGTKWSYQIGSNADYDATQERIVAWSGNDLYILNGKGRLIYNNSMSDEIQFASAGEGFVAAFIGQADNGVVTVINDQGQIVDNIAIENQTLLDIGFFFANTSSSAQQTELMWVLGLNTTGTVISMELQTYIPGRLATGKSSIGNHIAYAVYYADGLLHVVDTRKITHYNYRILEQGAQTLIYGYTLEDIAQNGSVTYQLLIPAQEQNDGMRINNVRLMYGDVDRMLHLPDECLAVRLGTHSVYAFSQNAVYVCRYGSTTFATHAMPVQVTAVLGMITDNRAIVASGSEIYVVELPQ